MGRSKPALVGARPRWLQCEEHGRYRGSVLIIGEREFPARCPSCARFDLLHYRLNAVQILSTLGDAAMTKHRKRRLSDREFFVRLVDDKTASRVAVGNFWAESDLEAIKMAEKEYPGLFAEMQTHTWTPRAEPTGKTMTSERSVAG